MSNALCLRAPRGVVLRDIRIEDVLGVRTVKGVLWPSGAHFAATLWAISGRPGGERPQQIVYTDRGAFRTGLDVYQFAAVVSRPLPDANAALPVPIQ